MIVEVKLYSTVMIVEVKLYSTVMIVEVNEKTMIN
jgi:hypothetical protein